ncbi:MAG: hypothetical protein KAI95_20185, partial [Bacteroidales bacterium]|nr:hypothetical protein [Bacteroidales bacterium]
NRLAAGRNKKVNVLLRINPDYIPAGMNSGSATSSRKNSLFGLDLKRGEVQQALELIKKLDSVNFKGYHFHIGTGILDPKDYYKVLKQLRKLIRYTFENDYTIELFDIGGGFGVATSREMTAAELIYIQAFGRLPNPDLPVKNLSFDRFFQSINTALKEIFIDYPFPELIIEPGRSIVSSNQLLLVRIFDVKSRKGIKKWVITDAGIGTAVMPVYYEFHEIVLCNDVNRIHNELVTITGPGCFAADIIYKDYRLPNIHPGEYLAVMDSGAYFTSWESNLRYPRPAIAVADNKKHTLIRDRENFDHMVQMDNY